jgi:hypothetical protein
MKRTVTQPKLSVLVALLLGVLTTTATIAQKSRKISFQGFLRDASGKAVEDGRQTIIFKLYSAPQGGVAEWTETQELNVFGGVCSTHLGGNTNPLEGLDWGTKTYYVGVTVQGLELTPRTELTFAPYALGAAKAQESICSGAVGDIKHSILNPTQFAAANGSCWVPMDGRALAPTDKYRQITGLTSIPDAGGLFFRGQEFDNSPNNDPDRTTATAIGTLQDQALLSHTHTGSMSTDSHYHNYASLSNISTTSGLAGYNFNGLPFSKFYPLGNVQTTDSEPNHTHTFTIDSAGGTETRPKNLNFWVYIRIN